MKRRSVFTLIIGAVVATGTTIFGIWWMQDEEPLDYSALDVELGPQDSSINGYTLMREIAEQYPGVQIDESIDPYDPEAPVWTIEKIDALLAENAEFMAAMDGEEPTWPIRFGWDN